MFEILIRKISNFLEVDVAQAHTWY